ASASRTPRTARSRAPAAPLNVRAAPRRSRLYAWSRRRWSALASSVALLALVSTWVAAQTGPGSTNALIPYSGYLESDGAAVTTPVDLRVGLFPSPSGTSCLASPTLSGCGVWADQMTDV